MTITKEAFSIVSLILEFWQDNYFIDGIDKAIDGVDGADDLQRLDDSEISNLISSDERNAQLRFEDSASKPQGTSTSLDRVAPLIVGRSINPKRKRDGSWNFYTILRFEKGDTVTFETIFSRPTAAHPVPKATASVWFQLKKRGDVWEVEYRFEHTHQTHVLVIDHAVTKTGLESLDKELLESHANLLASPLKRMINLIESKFLEMERFAVGV